MKTILGYLNKFIFFFIPETRGFALKRFLYRLQGYEIGENTRICSSARIYGPGKIVLGKNVWIGPEVMVVSSSLITIGDNSGLGPRAYVSTGTHRIGDIEGTMLGTGINMDVNIKRGSWIGPYALIMPGITIEEMTIVGASAVVTKDFPSYSILAGVPAKVIRDLRN